MTKYVIKSAYDNKIGSLELKIPDISGLLQTSTFNSKVTELENKIKTAENKPDISNLVNKTELKNVENKIPDPDAFVKLTDYSSEITKIKNDYAAKAILDNKISELKSQHIADVVKKVDNKVKNSSDILGFESRLEQKEDLTNELEREASFSRGNYYYNRQSYLLCEPKPYSFKQNVSAITLWKSIGIISTDLKSVANTSSAYPEISKDKRIDVAFKGNYMKQNKIVYSQS